MAEAARTRPTDIDVSSPDIAKTRSFPKCPMARKTRAHRAKDSSHAADCPGSRTNGRQPRKEVYLRSFLAKRVDGVILTPKPPDRVTRTAQVRRALDRAGVAPIVLLRAP